MGLNPGAGHIHAVYSGSVLHYVQEYYKLQSTWMQCRLFLNNPEILEFLFDFGLSLLVHNSELRRLCVPTGRVGATSDTPKAL